MISPRQSGSVLQPDGRHVRATGPSSLRQRAGVQRRRSSKGRSGGGRRHVGRRPRRPRTPSPSWNLLVRRTTPTSARRRPKAGSHHPRHQAPHWPLATIGAGSGSGGSPASEARGLGPGSTAQCLRPTAPAVSPDPSSAHTPTVRNGPLTSVTIPPVRPARINCAIG